jgi:glycosyltransferase involved in cell wall biosynthesis
MSETPPISVPAISVIVPHYDDLDRLDRCLASLAGQTQAAASFEVIVADNASPVGEEAVRARIAGRARLVIQPERGAGPARNAGVAAARGETLAFIDADCIADPRWIERGVAALAAHDLVGGRVDVLCESPRKSGAEAFETVFAFDNEAYVTAKGFSVTANLFTTRVVFDATGPFRTGVSEDTEWCWRARDRGFAIGYAADAVVAHPARADWPALHRKWQRMNAEMYELALTRPGGRLRWAAHSAALPLSIAAHLPRIATHGELSAAEKLRAAGTLARLRLWRTGDSWMRLAGLRR